MPRKRKNEPVGASSFIEADLEPASRPRLTPEDVQTREFRLSFRGYHEGDVDQFLDQVTEDLAALHEENKRLREQVGDPMGGPVDLQAAEERAERIVREAREHAARLVAEAERRTGDVAEGRTGSDAPGWYLLQERDFLERLASLVKDHAEGLKQRARSRPATESPTAEPAAPVSQPAPDDVVVVEESAADRTGGKDGQEGEEAADPGEDRIDLTPLEATAPISSVTTSDEHDLLRDWDERSPQDERSKRKDEGSSLKELFWGEDA